MTLPVSMLCKRDNGTTSAINVPGCIVYGRDHDRTAILCPREVNHFRRSWADHERCTAIMVGSTMLLSVYMPHSDRDEGGPHRGAGYGEGHPDRRQAMRVPSISLLAAISDIELRLGNAGEDSFDFLNSIEWYGL